MIKFSEETKINIAKSEAEIKTGKTISLNELKKKRNYFNIFHQHQVITKHVLLNVFAVQKDCYLF